MTFDFVCDTINTSLDSNPNPFVDTLKWEEKEMALKDQPLHPAHAQEIASRYGFKITGYVGTTPGRVLIAVLTAILALILSLIVVGFLNLLIGLSSSPYFELLTLAIWFVFIGILVPFLLVNVPKFTGLLVTSYFNNGTLHTFGPGLGLKYPWEQYSMSDYIDIRAISIQRKSRFVSKDGVGISFPWTQQYGPYLPLLPLYVRTEEKAIEDGFEEVVENAISEAVIEKNIKIIRTKETLDGLQKSVEDAIDGDIKDARDSMGSTIEERFGILAELTTMGPPEFDKDYSEALSSRVVRGVMTQDAKKMAKDLAISPEKAMKNVMMLNKENVSETIFTLHADENISGVARDMGEVLRAGREIGRGIQAARGRSSGSQNQQPSNPGKKP